MNHIKRIVLLLTLLAATAIGHAQPGETRKNNSNNKSEIKVNKLDVIYEDEEYKGIVIDRKNDRETESYMYQPPYMLNNDDEDDEDDDEMPSPFSLDDEGAMSEDEILYEGFDTAVIHLPKFDVASITDPIMIRIRNKAQGENFTWPTPVTSRPSSHFGPRRRRFHYGLDLAQPTGEPIYAAFDGVVRISKYNRSYGNLVIIHHANGLETYYAHMSKRLVNAGDQVRSGEMIGLCGNTGRSFGSHLHFEIRYMGNALNPEDVMSCATHDLLSDYLTLTPNSFRKVAKGGTARASRSGSTGNGNASGNGWYRIRQGDTLEKIARRNGTTIAQLCKLNGISRNTVIKAGEMIRVSGQAKESKASKAGTSSKKGGSTYTVREGDNLYRIASSHGLTVQELCKMNGISENKPIRPGQKLKVK